jgi:hypothetical protein
MNRTLEKHFEDHADSQGCAAVLDHAIGPSAVPLQHRFTHAALAFLVIVCSMAVIHSRMVCICRDR